MRKLERTPKKNKPPAGDANKEVIMGIAITYFSLLGLWYWFSGGDGITTFMWAIVLAPMALIIATVIYGKYRGCCCRYY